MLERRKHLLEVGHPAAVARDQAATIGMGGRAESVELGLNEPIGMVEPLCPPDRIDQWVTFATL